MTGPELPVARPGGARRVAVLAVLGARPRGAAGSEHRARLGPQIGGDEHARAAGPAAPRARGAGGADRAAARAARASTSPATSRGRASAGRRPPATSSSSAGSRRARDDTAWRRASTGTASHERARRGLLQQVAEDDHERALGALGAPERELVVAVDRARLEVEQRAHDAAPPCAARRQRGADLVVEGDGAAAVAELVGDERERGGGVELGVEDRVRVSPSGAADSRPASISSSRSRSCSSRYWLLIGRPSRAVARQLTWRMSSSGW